ncbi:DUF6510 family protein [Curtobacterium sp. MCPF17_002]|jgi:hypothetical protein|uniref:DUF6510 family protein n=1 Tax=Curtobacterium sp. MCPF17_002 TaxID=2175645 RepID=UPI000DA811C2|nr:DUF6510 family protein [Curtobacterium sp. MCPF17_002]WIB75854.1 DUF6510 family protein [Curtobacterium sp. MCPF17_002]
MSVLDGNALAGPLTEVLGPDPTLAVLRCSGCGSLGVLAVTRVYSTPMGAVARCRDCDTVLVTLVDTPDRRWIGMPGARAVAAPPA